MNRTALLSGLLGLILTGCGSTPHLGPTPDEETVRVLQREGEALTVEWTPPTALWVELRHTDMDSLLWRAVADGNLHGMMPLGSPLGYLPMGPPPGVYPPDGRGPEAGPPVSLTIGTRYTVVVAPCASSPTDGPSDGPPPWPPWTCEALPEQSATFTARYTGTGM